MAHPDRDFTAKVAWIADLLDKDTLTLKIGVKVYLEGVGLAAEPPLIVLAQPAPHQSLDFAT